MNRSLIALVAAAALTVAGSAAADPRYYDEPRWDYARVVRVDPIISTYNHPVSRDECWSEPVTYREPVRYRERGGSRDRAPAVLGAIVGGVIGNQFGSGHGRDAATAAGALLGYQSVRDSQRRDRYGYAEREVTRYEERCDTRTDYVQNEQVTGYDVTYRYRGQTYHTTTDTHPGDRIRVRVGVEAVP
jgi:uncharacterized protein YcfJ